MHFLINGHEQSHINSTMDLLQPCEKGTTPRLDSWENVRIPGEGATFGGTKHPKINALYQLA
jgi:hypothetical protein